VAEEIHDELVEALVRAAEHTSYGPPEDTDAAYGPLNSADHLTKVESFFDDLPDHAVVRTGGQADRQDGGFYFQPTVVTGVRQRDRIVQEEVFGPVITVQPFGSEEEAVTLANDVRFGLAAGLWTTNHDRVLRVSSELDFGKVWVNCHLEVAVEMPNTGYKHSGHGNDLSVLAIEEYTRVKHVMSAVAPV
jgi:betaine-aldehyde dehydrogenase